VTLDELADFLTSDKAPPGCMDLSELDGFLAGLAAGPERVPPEEWLPIVWDTDTPDFADAAEEAEVVDTITGLYAAIEKALDTSPLTYAAILWQDPAGNTVAEDWAAGFMQAVSLRADAWQAALADEEASPLLIPIATLAQSALPESERGVSLPDDALDTLTEEAEQVLPVCVAGLRRFWAARAADAGATRH
jgi:uncharacterized protein